MNGRESSGVSEEWGAKLLIDAGGNYIKYALTGEDGALREETFGEVPSCAEGSEEEILAAFRRVVEEAREKGAPTGCAVSIPDPFDYGTGTSLMQHKFKALYGKSLMPLFRQAGLEASFVQDTVAYILGEYEAGTFGQAARPCLITLGTGVGFARMEQGRVVVNGNRVPVPIVWNAPYEEGITEDYVSTRAIQDRYQPGLSVREIADRARQGDERAAAAFRETGVHLSRILNGLTRSLNSDLTVIGGQIAKSLDLFDLRTEVPFLRAANLDDAALRGLNAWLKLGQENCLMKES